jgi:cyclophilin family peptidyl-prolyl cis-trans isomerase
MLKFRTGAVLASLLFPVLAFANPQVVLETSSGNITIELYEKEMPKTVKNFLAYVDSGYYNGTVFHRIIPELLIQGGGYTKELAKKDRQPPIENESKDYIKNIRGTVAMARLSSPHTATSEFFINIANNAQFDYQDFNIGYAVFGKITDETMGTIDTMSYVQTGTDGMFKNVPTQPREIIKAYRIADSQGSSAPTPPVPAAEDGQ